MEPSSNKNVVIGIIAVTVLLFGGLVYLVSRLPATVIGPQEESGLQFSDADNPALGATSTKVTVHIYSDFQCPACRQAEPYLQQAIAQYQDRVRFVWKDFPLESTHKNARLGAEAARCAQAQGQYFVMHDKLFADQDTWVNAADPSSVLIGYAATLGLDKTAFQVCLSGRLQDSKVTADIREGSTNNVNGTPTFFINNARYNGMFLADWQKALDAALAK